MLLSNCESSRRVAVVSCWCAAGGLLWTLCATHAQLITRPHFTSTCHICISLTIQSSIVCCRWSRLLIALRFESSWMTASLFYSNASLFTPDAVTRGSTHRASAMHRIRCEWILTPSMIETYNRYLTHFSRVLADVCRVECSEAAANGQMNNGHAATTNPRRHWLSSFRHIILPRDAMLARYMPSSCVCVCLSHFGIVSKRLNVELRK